MKLRHLLAVACLPFCLRAAEQPPAPRLAVAIAVDQLRADYLVRFRPYFGPGGFERLLAGGANFENAHHRHSVTITAPGHASILTGVHANIHGIIANDWLDRATWEMVNNVEDKASPLVGIDPRALGPAQARNPEKTGRSPRNLQATTVGDQLKLRHGAGAKVFAASNKDRSAILMGGKLADGAYWDEQGRMVTSRYYREALPAWVEAFNAEQRIQKQFGQTWERLLDPKIYDAVQGPDDAPGEAESDGLTRTFPKRLNGGEPAVGLKFYSAMEKAPYTSEFLGAFVERAIKEEQLGRHAATDLLCVSFSQIDSAGHEYGPDSHEVMDAMLRLDRVLASLLDCLDREVGLKNCVIVLTADHGAAPLPERVQALRPAIPAGRLKGPEMGNPVKAALDQAFGPLPEGEQWATPDQSGLHLRPAALAAKKVSADDAARVAKAALLPLPFVAQAYTRAEILGFSAEGDSLAAKVRRSYYEPNDRDVVVVLKPYFFLRSSLGTTHGTPYDYDSHVPQVWYGAGVPRGTHEERVGVDDIAPTLSGLLGLPTPPQAQGRRLF